MRTRRSRIRKPKLYASDVGVNSEAESIEFGSREMYLYIAPIHGRRGIPSVIF